MSEIVFRKYGESVDVTLEHSVDEILEIEVVVEPFFNDGVHLLFLFISVSGIVGLMNSHTSTIPLA